MLDRKKASELRAQLEKVLADADFKGVGVTTKNGSFSENELIIKVSMIPLSKGVDLELQEFINHCGKFGLTREYYKFPFVSRGKDFILTGFQPSRRKFPIIGQAVGIGRVVEIGGETIAVIAV